jgi:branched-chain amino acid transport system permease protein
VSNRTRLLALAGLAIVVLVAPIFLDSYYWFLLGLALVNVVVALGLNLLTGNAGQISLCHSSFVAIGAYATTYAVTKLGIAFWLALPLGGAVAALFGFVLGFPALRLRGFYLAVVTLGFLEVIQIAIEQLSSITGGVRGMMAARPVLLGYKLSSDLAMYYLILGVAVLSIWCTRSILASPTGRALNAIRNSEAAAQTLAMPLASTKLGFIDPLEFGIWTSIRYVVFIVVGGLGSVAGSVLGAVALTLLPELLRGFKEYNEFVFGGLLLITLIVFPKGLVGLWPQSTSRLPFVMRWRRGVT